MAPFIDGFGGFLEARGYTPLTVRNLLKMVGSLGRWMVSAGLTPPDLSVARVDEFVGFRRAVEGGRPSRTFRRPLLLLLDYLTAEGVLPVVEPAPLNGLSGVIEAYRQWLTLERGSAATTIIRYVRTAGLFLAAHGTVDGDLAWLSSERVNHFLVGEARRCSVGAAKGRVAEMRCLLRFLYVTSRVPADLGSAVPPVAGWRDTGLPRACEPGTVQLLLDSCDRASRVGVRDFAIIMLLARLGLRSVEIARMRLDDIDWRAGEVTIRGKNRRLDRLPLPDDAGRAVAAYLVKSRPVSGLREVFLTMRAPLGPIRPTVVGDVVEQACQRAGIASFGAHRLRHSLATGMLAAGVPLRDISQVMRHSDLATTAIYAKVDLKTLRQITQPWGGDPR